MAAMAVMFVLLPVALAFAAAALAVLLWAIHDGQFDDLDTPALRILLDDERGPVVDASRPTGTGRPASNPPR